MSPVDHLARARDYLARGEEFYARAADEIIAAREADPTLGYREIGKRLARSEYWARELVKWRTSAMDTSPTPQRVTPATVKINVRKHITYADLTTEEMAALGYVVTDAEALDRRLFDECSPDEFEAQVEIQATNVQRCRDRLAVDRRVLAFLRSKERELGRPVTAGEFGEEIAVLLAEGVEAA